MRLAAIMTVPCGRAVSAADSVHDVTAYPPGGVTMGRVTSGGVVRVPSDTRIGPKMLSTALFSPVHFPL